LGRAEIFRAALLWLPALLVTALVLLPLIYLVVRAIGADRSAWGLILGPRGAATLLRSLGLALAVTVASIGLALPLAWLTVRTDLPLARLWSVLTALPLVIPSYIGAYLYVAMLGPRGMLQHWLEAPFGIQRLPDIYGFPGAFLVLTLFTYPYLLLLLRASLQQMDPALEAASRSLGLGPWRSFRRVVLPQLRPSLAAGSLLVALYTLRDFGAVSIMRYDSFTRVIYLQYKSAFDRSSAALMALGLALVAGVLVSLERSAARRARYHRSGAQTARHAQPIQLGVWRWPALLFCSLISLVGLILPAGVLGYWLWRGLAAGERLADLGPALWGSLSGAGLAAGFTLLAALPLALVTVRHPGRRERLLLGLAWTGYALPGLVVALGLVFFGVRYALPLYQSLLLLIAAYVILFLPMALGALRSALLQIHPSLEEAARSLGFGPSRAFRAVVLPLLRPGLGAALALVFLSAMKELPATLILSPIGFETLATRTWSAVGEAFFARAALPSLLLVALSSLPMSLLALREQAA
jgi:iron(III) transport system permease protein